MHCVRNILSIIFLSIYFFAFSQEPAIKIFLEDGFSHKNLKNAKVTLEGFELPQIIGKYNKTEQYYYFDSIPNGYNTVMAYHKKYNEKGFQEINEMPHEILLKLYPEYNISYEFLKKKYPSEIANNSKNGYGKIIKDEGLFTDVYVEDPNKILIVSMKEGSYRTIRDTIYNIVKPLGLIPINPYLPDNPDNLSLENLYPECPGNENGLINSEWLDENPDCKYLPIRSNNLMNYIDFDCWCENKEYDYINKNAVFFYKKNDGSKFQKFNDPILNKLKDIDGVLVYTLVYEKLRYRGKDVYNFKKFQKIDKEFKERLKQNENSLYPTIYSSISMTSNQFKLKKVNEKITEYSTLLMPGGKLSNNYIMIPIYFKGTYGLGILDNMDFYKEGTLNIPPDYKLDEYLQYYDEMQGAATQKSFWKIEDYNKEIENYKNFNDNKL